MSNITAALTAFAVTFIVGTALNFLVGRSDSADLRRRRLLTGVLPSVVVAIYVFVSR